MNILIFSIEFPPHIGGAGSYAKNLAVGLSRLGQKITVITSYTNKDLNNIIDSQLLEKYKELKIIRKRLIPKIYIILFSIYCSQIIKKEKYDCLIVADAGAQKSIAYSSKKINIPLFTVFHGTEINNYFKNQTKMFKIFGGRKKLIKFFNETSACIAVSEDLKNHILLMLPNLSDKLYVIHHGIDTHFFTKASSYTKQKTRIALGLSNTKKILFSASRLIKEKGHDILINSLPRVISKIPNVLLIIAGDGPDRQYLKKLVTENSLDKYVFFTNQLSPKQIVKYYHACDLFVLLSRRGSEESFGLVFLEANACNRGVIAGRTGGVKEAVEHGISGFVIDPIDTNIISNSIIKLLQDEKMLKKIQKSAHERIINKLTIEIMAENTLQVISKYI